MHRKKRRKQKPIRFKPRAVYRSAAERIEIIQRLLERNIISSTLGRQILENT